MTVAAKPAQVSQCAGRATAGAPARDSRTAAATQASAESRNGFRFGEAHIKKSTFLRFRDLIFFQAGINLTEKKIPLLEGRLNRRLRHLQISTFEEYYDFLEEGRNKEELVQMLDCISTNETTFFREPHQYTYLEQQVFPKIKEDAASGRRKRSIKVWSAACSTGDELYSAAMCLLSHFPLEEGWTIDALGTDISTRVLGIALQGVWPLERSKGIPPAYLKRFMLRGTGEDQGKMAAGDALRSVVRFKRLNLFTDSFSEHRSFDIIFCRNVMIYFNDESKRRVISKLVDCLVPGGFFLVGHAETLHGLDEGLKRHVPTIYSKQR